MDEVQPVDRQSELEGIVTKGNSSWRLQGTAGAKTVAFSANGVSPMGTCMATET